MPERWSHWKNHIPSGVLTPVPGSKRSIQFVAKDHHKLLDGIGDDFDGSSGLMGNTLGRVNKMLGGGKTNRQIMCYVVILIVFMFVIMWYFFSRVSSSSP